MQSYPCSWTPISKLNWTFFVCVFFFQTFYFKNERQMLMVSIFLGFLRLYVFFLQTWVFSFQLLVPFSNASMLSFDNVIVANNAGLLLLFSGCCCCCYCFDGVLSSQFLFSAPAFDVKCVFLFGIFSKKKTHNPTCVNWKGVYVKNPKQKKF